MGQSVRGNCIISTRSFCESKNAPGSLFESESKQVVTVKTAKNSHQSVCSQRLLRHLKSHSNGIVGSLSDALAKPRWRQQARLTEETFSHTRDHPGEWKALDLHGNENGEGAIAHRQTVTFGRPWGCVVVSLW